jgi:hypothetical protein
MPALKVHAIAAAAAAAAAAARAASMVSAFRLM